MYKAPPQRWQKWGGPGLPCSDGLAEKNSQQSAQISGKHMLEGRMRAALRLISEDNSNCLLHLDNHVNSDSSETVRDILYKKHPLRQPMKESSIITSEVPPDEPHPILFDRLDGQLICSTAFRTDRAAGPFGLNSNAWKYMCTYFKSTSTELCDALASTSRRICNSYADLCGLTAFVACLLIAQDKYPGVRPIGIGEVLGALLMEQLRIPSQKTFRQQLACFKYEQGNYRL